jgi:hypothetical protein
MLGVVRNHSSRGFQRALKLLIKMSCLIPMHRVVSGCESGGLSER